MEGGETAVRRRAPADLSDSPNATGMSGVSRFRAEHLPSRTTVLAWLILAAAVVAVLLAFWPGRVNIDTMNEIAEAETGEFTNRSVPLLLALWHLVWGLGFGVGAVFATQVLTFVLGAYLVLRAAFRPVGASVVTAVIAFWPPVLGNLASLQRDTWFAALLLLTFGLVVRASQRSWPVRGRYLALAVVAAWLTLASRQNAAPAVVLACIPIAGLLLARRRQLRSPDRDSRALGRSGVIGAVAAGIALTLALMATQFVATRALEPTNVHPETPLYVYDLATISERERENLFPAELMPQRGIAPIDRTYDVDSILPFLIPESDSIGPQFSQAVGFPNVGDAPAGTLQDAWLEAVTDHPSDYLAGRWTLWMRQIGVTRDGLSVYPLELPESAGYPYEFPGLYDKAIGYLEAFTYPDPSFYGHAAGGSVLFDVWIYLLVALAAAIILLRRSRPLPLIVVGTLAVAALTYQVGFFFVALGTRFKYEFPCVVIGMIAAAVLLHLAWTRWRASRDDEIARPTAKIPGPASDAPSTSS